MRTNEYLSHALGEVLTMARRVSEDVANEVESILEEGRKNPLSREEVAGLIRRVAETIRVRAMERGDKETASSIGEDIEKLVAGVLGGVMAAEPSGPGTRMSREHTVHLLENHNGVGRGPVIPRPWFHEKDVPMVSGYVRTTDIQLWGQNVRLDIHIGQFREKFGREPSSEELLDIMMSKLELAGVSDGDQFKIVDLARSIAINGVRKPPIIDVDGTLLDGNRRVTACYYILNNDEFTTEEKKRAEYIFVWQLTPDATDDDRNRVVVSLNFEPDFKQDWPEYVKARKVYEEWQAILTLEPVKPGLRRQAAMKRELSQKFALGPDTNVVNRYIKMVGWADEFEDYHIEERKRDKFAVKHTSSDYFQYFEELGKGEKAGGVAYCLNQDEGHKKLAFDLLYDGKFRNWNQIRKLKLVFDNEEARERLRMARDENDIDEAQDLVDEAISIADTKSADKRSLGANTRIEMFVKWLEELPVKAFRDEIKPANLQKLLDALMLVSEYAKVASGSGGSGDENGPTSA